MSRTEPLELKLRIDESKNVAEQQVQSYDNLMLSTALRHPNAPPLYMDRYLTGYGFVKGGIAVHVTNTLADKSLRFHYLDVIPSFLRLYFHTTRVALNETEISESSGASTRTVPYNIFSSRITYSLLL